MSDAQQSDKKGEYEKFKDKIGEIKEYLKAESKKIVKCVKDGAKESELFDPSNYQLKETNEGYSCEYKGKKKAGIYVFYSNEPEIEIPKDFDDVNYGAKLNEDNKNTKQCLYVGKSYDLKKRINEHLSGEDKSPYSLKCGHSKRKELFKNSKVYIFELKDEKVEYKELILPTIEGFLHNELKPRIGSPRT